VTCLLPIVESVCGAVTCILCSVHVSGLGDDASSKFLKASFGNATDLEERHH